MPSRLSVGLFAAVFCLGIGLATTRARSQSLITPTYTGAQAKRGEMIYMNNCVACHGDHLDNGEFGPPLAGPAFVQHWGGKGLDEPFTLISTTMPPDNPGGLGGATYADVMAFILRENGIASSATELPSDLATLKGMAAPK
jgi:mono/diheme cytochrome c family protein